MAKLNKGEVDRYLNQDFDIANRTLYIGSGSYSDGEESGVDGLLAERVIKALHVLDHQFAADDRPIKIQLNCIGGDSIHGFAIYDAINHCKNFVGIEVYGHAMSMGSVILQAGDERVLAPNSRVLLHYGHVGLHSEVKSTISHIEDEKKWMVTLEDIYLEKIREKHPQFKRVKLKDMLSHDTILTAKQAVDLGLADKIMV